MAIPGQFGPFPTQSGTGVALSVADCDGDSDGDCDMLCVRLCDGDCDGVGLSDGEGDSDCVCATPRRWSSSTRASRDTAVAAAH